MVSNLEKRQFGLKQAVKETFSSPWVISIIVIFSVLFLYNVFIMTQDWGLLFGYEIDPGSIVKSMYAMFDKPIYSMHNGYHSTFYGWTYFSLNFIVLALIKFVSCLFGAVPSTLMLLTSIRTTLFFIGMLSTILFFEISVCLFKSKWVSFILALFFMLTPEINKFFYFIHPETTGIALSLCSTLCLIKFMEHKAERLAYYYTGLTFAVLSALSKQPFFIMSVAIMFLYFDNYCSEKRISYYKCLLSKDFIRIFINTVLIAFLILIVIHPYSILDFKNFVLYQKMLASGEGGASFLTKINSWLPVLKSSALIVLNMVFCVVLPFLVLIRRKVSKLFLYSVFFCGVNILFFVMCANHPFYINTEHLMPIYPFLLLNIAAALLFIWKVLGTLKFPRTSRTSFLVLICLFFAPKIYSNLMYTSCVALERANYKKTTVYVSYLYIKKNIPKGKKILWAPGIALPDEYNDKSACHIWTGCANLQELASFNPDYMLFADDYLYSSKDAVFEYVKSNKFNKVMATKAVCPDCVSSVCSGTLSGVMKQVRINYNNDAIIGASINVYKKR